MSKEMMIQQIARYFETQPVLKACFYLKDLLGCEVDLITEGGLMPFARESADRDKILIYERAA